MTETTGSVFGISFSLIALILSVFCMIWILMHIKKANGVNPWEITNDKYFNGGVY